MRIAIANFLRRLVCVFDGHVPKRIWMPNGTYVWFCGCCLKRLNKDERKHVQQERKVI